jgi:hypothetical protein
MSVERGDLDGAARERAEVVDAGLCHGPSWTIARLIALVDEAIDVVGEQLVRSGGLTVWSDDFAPARKIDKARRPAESRDLSVYEGAEPVRAPGVL